MNTFASSDYSKTFQLSKADKKGHINAVLTQDCTNFSMQLGKVEQGISLCYQGLAAAAYAYQKAFTITMGYKVELFTLHTLHALITRSKFVLTNA